MRVTMMRTVTLVAAVMTAPTDHAHSAAVAAAMHTTAVAAAVHATTTAAATVAAGAGFSHAEHCKAEHRTRRDGQKGRPTNHDTLL